MRTDSEPTYAVDTNHLPEFTGDIPTLSFRFRGQRWRIKVYAGRLLIDGEEHPAFFSAIDRTITMTEAHFKNTSFRETLATLRECCRQWAIESEFSGH